MVASMKDLQVKVEESITNYLRNKK